ARRVWTEDVVVRSLKARLRKTSARAWTASMAPTDCLLAAINRRQSAFASKRDAKKEASKRVATRTSTSVVPEVRLLKDSFTFYIYYIFHNLYSKESAAGGARVARQRPESVGCIYLIIRLLRF